MRELQIQEVELTSSPRSRNEHESDHPFENGKIVTTYQQKCIQLYHILVHIFLFSVFESFFFWFYIVYQEEKAFRGHFKDLTMISNLMCVNMQLDLEPLYTYMEEEHRIYNNQVPLRFTYVLNGSLFSLVLGMNLILYWQKQSLYKINLCILKQDSVVLIGLFLYEYLFFQNIIYNYKPHAAMDIKTLLFTQCTPNL